MLWPMVWYMKLSRSCSSSSGTCCSGVDDDTGDASVLVVFAGCALAAGWRFANATTLWPLRMQWRSE